MNALITSMLVRPVPLLWNMKQSVLLKRSIVGTKGLHTSTPVMEIKGQIASKSPTKVQCESGKTYTWCACGLSGKQPFCDGSHKRSPVGLTPLQWTATDTKDYFFCNCKQTNKKPFCDGSHKKL